MNVPKEVVTAIKGQKKINRPCWKSVARELTTRNAELEEQLRQRHVNSADLVEAKAAGFQAGFEAARQLFCQK